MKKGLTINRLTLQLIILFATFVLLLTACIDAQAQIIQPTAVRIGKATQSPTLVPTNRPTVAPTSTPTPEPELMYDGAVAYQYVADQMKFGPRWPGSDAHTLTGDFIRDQLESMGWLVEEQLFEFQGFNGRNIIGKANLGAGGIILIGAHYDTRVIADQTEGSNQPVPGAVDGASGVAVLLELARSLDLHGIDKEIWLVFFDLEDNGSGAIPGFDWSIGSQYLAQNLEVFPEQVVIVDMVGDADQQLYYEGYSDPGLQQSLWQIAAGLGYGDRFIPELRHSMIDDHRPFIDLGIPTALIIDFDYPYWHTIEDTLDKIGADSLESVGRTLEVWLEERVKN